MSEDKEKNKGLSIYESMSRPPNNAIKTIKGGRLNGYTDINPQWRYAVMTETFGLCGVGWKYIVTRQWTEPGTAGQVFAFVNVDLCIKVDGEWSEPIPGSGGHQLITKERNGLHDNDEAFKMATTDALSVAMKVIGVGAYIYSGEKSFASKYEPILESTKQTSKNANKTSTQDEFQNSKDQLFEKVKSLRGASESTLSDVDFLEKVGKDLLKKTRPVNINDVRKLWNAIVKNGYFDFATGDRVPQ